MPFAGCRVRCVYCAQDLQTGAGHSLLAVGELLDRAESMLAERLAHGLAPAEAAFYGGTFTNLPAADLSICMERAAGWIESGLSSGWRCSTRPDCLSPLLLGRMRALGCHTVELGIQSMDAEVLRRSRRNYAPEVAREGMAMVVDAGLHLGAQLLPGLPASTPQGFVEDVEAAVAAHASLMRFYPCLVLKNTALERMYLEGRYRPWDCETAVAALAHGLLVAGRGGIPVARIGVADEPGLAESIVAGPWDPAMGTRVMSRALLLALTEHTRGACVRHADIPRFAQGYLFGERRENAPFLQALGIDSTNVSWTQGDEIHLELDDGLDLTRHDTL